MAVGLAPLERNFAMFDVGSIQTSLCQAGLSRRALLKSGVMVLGAVAGCGEQTLPVRKTRIDSPRAKSVIFIWLRGGPSQLDTFDPKPDVPYDYRGPFSAISTKQPGVCYSELLPMLAARSDRFSLIRSHVTARSEHPEGTSIGLTGFGEHSETERSHFDSVLRKYRGCTGTLLPSLTIPEDIVHNREKNSGRSVVQGADPFIVRYPNAGDVENAPPELSGYLASSRISNRREIQERFYATTNPLDQTRIDSWNCLHSRTLLTDRPSQTPFDLTRESILTREAYGHTTFGRSCLLARRLVEAQVPYIQVNWGEHLPPVALNAGFNWDTHAYNFELLKNAHCPIFDQAFSALLDDLQMRGMLESTLVVAMGEFGRTPKINNCGGRDDWSRCYFSLWSGGGVVPGRVIGASDKYGEEPVTRGITPRMVSKTIHELAGWDTQSQAMAGTSTISELLEKTKSSGTTGNAGTDFIAGCAEGAHAALV